MNYTTNHHLPQWAKSDRILMDDFNDAMANIDSGLTSAQSAANAARQEAAALPYAVGSYTGADVDHSVTLGFRPSFVLINGIREGQGSSASEEFRLFSGAAGANSSIPSCLVFTSTGFIAKKTTAIFPNLVLKGRNYEYIAFK